MSDKVKIGDFVRIRIPNRLGQVGNHYSDTVYEVIEIRESTTVP